ncbi:hypothetical protein BV22DRAFT_1034269 [Leucogyrophana mollusca]|uniref:Uncharacterized protein n=1 Tax=Leucogyrophana mollusca TaxID=85980 RepID=A0ACB8BIX1_9AGAM|nr:hypothetical protein BV22DRAFT_1034269 [Leucogyrophana mollusca]
MPSEPTSSGSSHSRPREDVILPMTDQHMQHIVRGEKTYEFRRYFIAQSVRRIWFYLNAPFSHVAYVCEIDPARTRNEGDEPLPEDGLGNKEFNQRNAECDRYDYAYRVRSVYRLHDPISLKVMKARYGFKGAPRSLVYVPPKILEDVAWDKQQHVRSAGHSLSSGSIDLLTPVPEKSKQIMESSHGKTRKRGRHESGQDTRNAKKQVCSLLKSLTSPLN